MKKCITVFLLLFLLSCTKETTIYIDNVNFNDLTKVEIDKIDAVGAAKIEIIMDEMRKGEFKGKKDFERRMEGKLSPKMILRIIENHEFKTTYGGT
jgi:hypothetical protein